MNLSKDDLVLYLEKASLTILGLLFIFFPLIFTNLTTDIFAIPKQAILIFAVLVLMVLFGVKSFFDEKLRVKRTPFDLPVLIFIGSVFLSVIFSVAQFDSLFNFVPLLFAGLSFFAISYNAKDQRSITVLAMCLLAGGALTSLFSLFNFLKVYIFAIDFTKVQTFTPLGSVLDQAIYLALLIPIGAYFLWPFIKNARGNVLEKSKDATLELVIFGVLTIGVLVGLFISIYESIYLQHAVILPLSTGFQTAFAAISQDGGRVIQGFLFGSGYGEFSLVFSKFKQATFNSDPTLWSLTFFRSTSFVLELLATTGILGLLSFFLIIYRLIKDKPLFIPLIVFIAISFVLPFSFYHIALMFFILGLYASLKSLKNNPNYFDVELQLVASKKGFFVLSTEEVSGKAQEKYGRLLSSIVLLLIIVFVLIFGLLSFDYLSGNVKFQQSLTAAAKNNGSDTYNLQSNVLNSFTGKYVDAYYRVFSQTNLALANSLASSEQTQKNASPSAQTQQTVYTLVQQSINAARNATTLSKNNALNWQNLSSIYRSLIGFGQNADQFAILAAQQSITLDSTNPQEYINLGGLYYQMQSWDNALAQFQQAINLKPDFPNAYYNHAHVLIQKGDFPNALTELQTVKTLIKNDPTNLKQINTEIKDLQAKIASGATANTQTQNTTGATALPKQSPEVKIPAPAVTAAPTPTTIKPSPTAAPATEGGLPIPTETPKP